MTITTACIETWPVTLFWTWLALTIGVFIGAWWASAEGDRSNNDSARQRGEGVE
jgi:hypothetical protein